ncbi:hypothetical protein KA013_04395 [Patescibacteria group bacterium]|nr:hypothetical protein [Patescibacteria group bacterium]
MKLANFPELQETYVDEKLFTEWKEALPKVIRGVEAAKQYFVELTSKRTHDQPLTIQEINPGYVYILDQCISFSENKRKINDAIGKNLNENIYHKLTGRYGYSGTLGQAQAVTEAFHNPKIFEGIVERPTMGENIYLTRDTFEQAYRICDYVLAYLKDYITDDRLQSHVEETERDIANNL